MSDKGYILSLLLLLAFSLGCFSQRGDAIAKTYILGDVDNNGDVTIEDINTLSDYILGRPTTEFSMYAADVNVDGDINITDLAVLTNMVCKGQEAINDSTLYVTFNADNVVVNNPVSDIYTIIADSIKTDIEIRINSKMKSPKVCVRGESHNGRICIYSDVDYTLVLSGVNLSSAHAPAINSMSKKKTTVILANETENVLVDAKNYVLADSIELASGCFSCQGPILFKGNGSLNVTGNSKHAIYSKKSITFTSGEYVVEHAASDAVHSGKNITIEHGRFHLSGMQGEAFDMDEDFTMNDGDVVMNITGEAAKGIKSAGIMTVNGGTITAEATGALKNKKGNLSYCTIMKCDSTLTITGGDLHLINHSPGGKCISADRNINIEGGSLYMETHGDGAEYTNVDGEADYYTSKCIATDDSLFLHRGNIQCLSTGLGGKGIVADEYMEIGVSSDTDYSQGPTVNVKTTNTSIVNDVDEDKRYGCPKAIKTDSVLNIYSGDLFLRTDSMGGEGIECNDSMFVYGGNIVCDTFDDGINVANYIEINGGVISTTSKDNDGIDSNGGLVINGGYVMASSQHKKNESLDAEESDIHINGGTVIGLCSRRIEIGKSAQPVYIASVIELMNFTKGMKYDIVNYFSNEYIFSFVPNITANDFYLLMSSPQLKFGERYAIKDNNGNFIGRIQPSKYK